MRMLQNHCSDKVGAAASASSDRQAMSSFTLVNYSTLSMHALVCESVGVLQHVHVARATCALVVKRSAQGFLVVTATLERGCLDQPNDHRMSSKALQNTSRCSANKWAEKPRCRLRQCQISGAHTRRKQLVVGNCQGHDRYRTSNMRDCHPSCTNLGASSVVLSKRYECAAAWVKASTTAITSIDDVSLQINCSSEHTNVTNVCSCAAEYCHCRS
jgi:hypothetical protein